MGGIDSLLFAGRCCDQFAQRVGGAAGRTALDACPARVTASPACHACREAVEQGLVGEAAVDAALHRLLMARSVQLAPAGACSSLESGMLQACTWQSMPHARTTSIERPAASLLAHQVCVGAL